MKLAHIWTFSTPSHLLKKNVDLESASADQFQSEFPKR